MISINKTQLASYLISKAIETKGGLKIDPGGAIQEKKDVDGNLLSLVWNGLKALTGFLVNAVKAIFSVFSFSALTANLIQGVRFALTFDFGQSDKSIDAQIKASWEAWKTQFAGALGNTAGWFVCGGIANATVFVFNPVAGAAVLKDLGEEAFEEMLASLGAMTRLTVNNVAKEQALTAFKNVRRWLKEPNNPIYPLLPASLKEAWQKNKPWTLGAAIERRIISWFPPSWKDLVEEFIEEFLDGCQEALIVVASSLDRFVAERRTGILGGETVLEVTPNREEPQDKFLLAGPQELVRSQVVQALTDRRWLADKDLGIQVDEAASNILLAAQPFSLYGWVVFRSIDGKDPGRRPTYQLPAFDRAKVNDYDRIRAACGGANGYLWGRFLATATTSIGHPLIVRGGSADEAGDRLEALGLLCELEILTINITEERKSHKRLSNPALQKEARRVLPYRLVLANRKYYTDPRPDARPSKNGSYDDIRFTFDISGTTKPPLWDEMMAEVLRGPSASAP